MKKQNITTSVILSSYNQPNCLRLVLTGFAVQNDLDFEMIVADDGSDEDTIALLQAFQKTLPFDLRIVSQEHTVFRKSRILNLAVSKSRGEQLLFCDGDCIPFPDFIETHKRSFGANRYATGGYIRLTEAESRPLNEDAVRAGEHMRFLEGERAKMLRRIHNRNCLYRLFGVKDKPKILGGNVSVDRQAFVAINGFDERFEGGGGEDSDLRNRLNNLGCKGASVWNSAFVCHLNHGLDPRRTQKSVVRSKRLKALLIENKDRSRIDRGLDQHLG